MTAAKVALALANYAVALLNALDANASGEAKDWLATLAWFGSGSYWLWQVVTA